MSEEQEVFPVDEDDTDIVVTLELDDGVSVEAEILAIFEAAGRDFIALLPVERNGEPIEKYGVLIYRYFEDPEDGAPDIQNIPDDAEFAAARAEFQKLLAEAEAAGEL